MVWNYLTVLEVFTNITLVWKYVLTWLCFLKYLAVKWNAKPKRRYRISPHFVFRLGFVHPLQDVAFHQCLPLSSVCCFPDLGGSLVLVTSSCRLLLSAAAAEDDKMINNNYHHHHHHSIFFASPGLIVSFTEVCQSTFNFSLHFQNMIISALL